jgi:transcriptional regulator with XRE-family HTH domain
MPGPLDDPFAVPERPPPGRRRRGATLPDLLCQEMDRRGITAQGKLGDEIGVGQATVSRLLSGRGVPREETLDKIADFLHMPITDVRRAAERAAGEPTRFTLPREFDQLNKGERELILRMGWTLLAAHGRRVTRRS